MRIEWLMNSTGRVKGHVEDCEDPRVPRWLKAGIVREAKNLTPSKTLPKPKRGESRKAPPTSGPTPSPAAAVAAKKDGDA